MYHAMLLQLGLLLLPPTPANPTGTYRLAVPLYQRDGERLSPAGEIRVKRLSSTRLVIGLYADRGAPSYNTVWLLDTVAYDGHQAVLTSPEDASCRLRLQFVPRRIRVRHQAADRNFSCGFGQGVDASGTYQQVSAAVPQFTDPRESD